MTPYMTYLYNVPWEDIGPARNSTNSNRHKIAWWGCIFITANYNQQTEAFSLLIQNWVGDLFTDKGHCTQIIVYSVIICSVVYCGFSISKPLKISQNSILCTIILRCLCLCDCISIILTASVWQKPSGDVQYCVIPSYQ